MSSKIIEDDFGSDVDRRGRFGLCEMVEDCLGEDLGGLVGTEKGRLIEERK